MKSAYIVGGLRSPIGKTNGVLKNLLPHKMAAILLNKLIDKYNINCGAIDKVILANAVGPGGNIARLSLLEAGWSFSIPGVTVDFQCGGGLEAVNLAAHHIVSGQCEMVIAGGVESTSMEPKRQYNKNDPRYKGEGVFYKRAQFSPESIGDPDMLESAENVASNLNISRREMDLWAIESHRRAAEASKQKLLKDVIVPLSVNGTVISYDESIRAGMSLKLAEKARSVVRKGGSITAVNACLTHDGAAVILVASKEALEKYGLKPSAKIIEAVDAGVDPNLSPLGVIAAVQKLIKKTNVKIDDIDAFEVNEAFAVKVLAFIKEFNISPEKVNIWGGALAYGHPYGASGAIILIHLLEILKKLNKRIGVAAIGVAGGQGAAMMIERCDA
ncbi:acetyl-CoA C-acetyltransferase [Caldanaerobius fijiensis DSM 17918]|uniref:acetyl-CoA C-acetyltransferase n=1 Tax=Caldanaerobius fijiensis DSM 17918 TaxID=1121256 RepID=A0A1M4SND5_9THEO|nr:thiolase family protein [Caldanaerobius fijiensis]SHE33467.1 acetyl-CoA C-acetyltransferase [Caldanaerobius fijiensis DSM 17918]